jgi:hypothetical protein
MLLIPKFRSFLFYRSVKSVLKKCHLASFATAKTFLLVIFLFAFNSFCKAQTSVSGDQGDSTWTLAKSPYNITGNVLVPQGKTLTIKPGVVVQFPQTIGANSELIVKGTLKAIGSSDSKIMFTGGTITGQSIPYLSFICRGTFCYNGVHKFNLLKISYKQPFQRVKKCPGLDSNQHILANAAT